MSDKKKTQTKQISFEHIGGKKVGQSVPAKAEKPLDFSSIGGRCVRKVSDQ